MSKPDLTIIEGGKVDEPLVQEVKLPERVEFPCWKCGLSCVLYPKSEPKNATQHAIPVCSEWERIVSKKDDLERFLTKSGVNLLTTHTSAGGKVE